jgi:hypothetical protein
MRENFFDEKIADKTIQRGTDKTILWDERFERLKTYFNIHFAVDSIGKSTLGRY